MKVLEENIGGTIQDNDKTPKPQATKAELDQWSYFKHRSFYIMKETADWQNYLQIGKKYLQTIHLAKD